MTMEKMRAALEAVVAHAPPEGDDPTGGKWVGASTILLCREALGLDTVRFSEGSPWVECCESLALFLHHNHFDKQGLPYADHLQAVALRVQEQGHPWHVICAAWLHDSVEDKKISAHDLAQLVPADVTDLVEVLTRRDAETYPNYILRVAKTPRAIPIKLADIHDNLDEERRGALPEPERSRLRARYHAAQAVLSGTRT